MSNSHGTCRSQSGRHGRNAWRGRYAFFVSVSRSATGSWWKTGLGQTTTAGVDKLWGRCGGFPSNDSFAFVASHAFPAATCVSESNFCAASAGEEYVYAALHQKDGGPSLER